MYYTIFQNQKTGNLWFKKFNSIDKQKRAIVAVIRLTNNTHYDNLTFLSDVKSKIINNNKMIKKLKY